MVEDTSKFKKFIRHLKLVNSAELLRKSIDILV